MPKNQITTAILHIGRHKTGTTSIQATLAAHRDLLGARGVLYPSSLPVNLSGFFTKAFHPAPEQPLHNRQGLTRTAIRKGVERQITAFKEELAAASRPCRR